MTERFRIRVAEAGGELLCGPNENLLDACLRAGIAMPYNCRSGECGECKVQVISGTVRELPGADPAIFDDTDRAAGRILACMCYPTSEITLSAALRDASGPAIGEIEAVVEEIRPLGASVIGVTLRTDWPVEYRAGQYFEWAVPGIQPNRCYSAANPPGSERIEFHVRLYPDGRISRLLAEGGLAAGDRLCLTGPFGTFGLSDDTTRPAVLVAGGTGLAPIKAMLEEVFRQGERRDLLLFHGARCRDDLYQHELLAGWAAEHAGFRFVPALSHEPAESDWQGARGLVTAAMTAEFAKGADLFGAEAYLCGPPPMIDAAAALLVRLGVDPSDVHADRFTPVG